MPENLSKMESAEVNGRQLFCGRQQQALPKLISFTQRSYLTSIILIVIVFAASPINASQLPSATQHQAADQSSSATQLHETRCLACIRSVTSAGVDLSRRCEGYYCGPYQFSYQYWAEAGKPGKSDGVREFEKCARDTNCAESTVRAYYKKFKRDCDNDGLIDCLDMAALHKVGPASCSQDWFYKSRYWQAFNKTSCAVSRDFLSAIKVLSSPNANELKTIADNKNNSSSQTIVQKNQTLTSECLDCICEALTSCGSSSSSMVNAHNCGSGTVCGPFAISQSYWKDGRRPGASWTACTKAKECSIVTIKNYMDKHKRDCNGDGFVTCEDYAAIHRRGPKSCMNRDLYKEHYWTKFTACRANQRPKNDASLVRAGDNSGDQSTTSSLISRLDLTLNDKDSSATGHGVDSMTSPQSMLSTAAVVLATTIPTSTQTPFPPITLTNAQTSTRFMRPNQSDGSRFEISAQTASDSDRGNSHTHQYSSLSPIETYELNPIVSNAKPLSSTGDQMSTQSPPVASSQHTHEYSESHNTDSDSMSSGNTQNDDQLTSSDSMTSSGTIRPGSQSVHSNDNSNEENHKSLATIYSHEFHHQPSAHVTDEYNSLPTIIVGKPLGSISTSHVSQPPPLQTIASSSDHSYPHDDSLSSIDQHQYQSTKMTQTPTQTTMSMHPMTTISFTSQSPNRHTTTRIEQLSSTTITPGSSIASTRSSRPNQSSTNVMINQDEPIDADYLVHDLGPAGFDRMVNGIVTSPDFSKSYPPIPEHLIQQRKQPVSTPSAPPRGPSSQAHRKEQITSMLLNHGSETPQPDGMIGGKNENRAPQSDHQQATDSGNLEDQHAQGGGSKLQQPHPSQFGNGGGGPIVGIESLNLTNLFDGSLNESSRIPSECLDCICDASSNCDSTVQCISKQREKNRCGLYMISWNQYKESDIALTALMSAPAKLKAEDQDEKLYIECTTDKNCAEKLIHLYIEKYSKDCNHDGKVDCYDVAALHRVGPDQCNSDKFLISQYWRDFNHCYATDRLTTTVQPQQLGQVR